MILGFRLLHRHRARLAFLFTGIVLVSTAWVTFTTLAETMTVVVDQDLACHWHTSYDLLVRSPGTRLPVERGEEMVRVNYLANLPPAISLQQYEAVRAIPEVEIAAPITMLGYLSLRVTASEPAPAAGLFRQDIRIQVDNGLTQGVAVEQETYHWLFSSQHESIFQQQGLWCPLASESATGSSSCAPLPVWLDVVPWRPEYARAAFPLSFWVPMLVAAVDPEAEASLVGLDRAVVQGSYLSSAFPTCRYESRPPALLIPALVHRDLFVHLRVEHQVVRLQVPAEPLASLLQRISSKPAGVRQFPTEGVVFVDRRTGGEYYSAQWQEALQIAEGDFGQRVQHGDCNPLPPGVPTPLATDLSTLALPVLPGGDLWPLPSPIRYRREERILEAQPVDRGNALQAVPDFTQDFPPAPPEPLFRSPPRQSLGRVLILPVGLYDVSRLELEEDVLAAIPVETYYPPTLTIRAVDDQPPDQAVFLHPSLSPLGYLQSPPVVLTNLQTACTLLSGPCISAIRVRVRDMDRFSPQAQKRLEAVAGEIVRRTGLTVDIVTGSSPREVLVRLPGRGQGATVTVAEPWVQKGVHITLQQRVRLGDRLLAVLMLLLTVVYIFNLMLDTVFSYRTFLGVSKAVGWRSGTLFGSILLWAVGIGGGGGVLACTLAWLFARWIGWHIPAGYLGAIPLLSAGLTGLGALYPAWWASQIPPVAVLRPPLAPQSRFLRVGSWLLRMLLRQGVQAWGGWVIMAGTSFVLSVAIGSLLSNAGYMALTFLGRYIMLHIERYHFALLVGLVVIGGLAIADWLFSVMHREKPLLGLLKSFGWQEKDVFHLWVSKGLLIGLSAGTVGSALGAGVLGWIGNANCQSVMGGVGLGLTIPALVSALAALGPARLAARIPPVEALRET